MGLQNENPIAERPRSIKYVPRYSFFILQKGWREKWFQNFRAAAITRAWPPLKVHRQGSIKNYYTSSSQLLRPDWLPTRERIRATGSKKAAPDISRWNPYPRSILLCKNVIDSLTWESSRSTRTGYLRYSRHAPRADIHESGEKLRKRAAGERGSRAK